MKLVKYDAARRALEAASSIDEVKNISDQAEALKHYARQKKDTDMEAWVCEIKLRAVRRIGELSQSLEKAQGARTDLSTLSPARTKFKTQTLKAAGLSRQEASRCERIAEIPEEEFESYIATKETKGKPVSVNEVIQHAGRSTRRKARVGDILQASPLIPGAKFYNVLYADPPWQYRNVISESRRIENQYPTMSLDDIKALPVEGLAAPDAVLFLWATSPGLQEALSVLNAWGFTYRSSAVWVKPSIGPGHWFRAQHELLLLGARGTIPVPAPDRRPGSVIEAPRGKHSEKPDIVYELIEGAYPEFSRIELFARDNRPGWDAWGNQVPIRETA